MNRRAAGGSQPAPSPDFGRSAARIPVALILLSLLTACDSRHTREAEYYVFGTLVDVSLAGVEDHQADRAFRELQRVFRQMHRDWHPWEPGLLTEVNRAFAEGRSATASDDIIMMIRAAQEFERRTSGRFNAAIGHLIGLWGFHTSEFPIRGKPPDPERIRELADQRPSSLDIEIHGTRVFDRSGRVRLDFSGLAKGVAVDRACALLQGLGIENALVSAGGDLRGYGRRQGRPWRIGVRNPLGGVIGTVDLQGDEAVFTSGNYERFRVDEQDERYPHILDPRTGWPAREVMSATVIAADGITADAAATALIVAGLANWREVAEPLGIEEVLLADEQGRIFATPEMLQRLTPAPGIEAAILPTR